MKHSHKLKFHLTMFLRAKICSIMLFPCLKSACFFRDTIWCCPDQHLAHHFATTHIKKIPRQFPHFTISPFLVSLRAIYTLQKQGFSVPTAVVPVSVEELYVYAVHTRCSASAHAKNSDPGLCPSYRVWSYFICHLYAPGHLLWVESL